MELVLKKKVSVSLLPCIIIGVTIYTLRNYTDTLLVILNWVNVAFWLIIILTNLIKRDYILFDGEHVTIHDVLRKWSFNQMNIEYIVINYSPFCNTYFKLKDNQERHFDPWWLTDDDIAKLHLICSNIKYK